MLRDKRMVSLDKQKITSSRRQIGYFCCTTLGEKHLGAVLITNQIGVPIEFKYTEPVVATKFHRILYGQVLDRYLHETVIRERLAQEIGSQADYFITSYEEKDFLGLIAGKEMLAIQRYQLPPGEFPGTFARLRETEAIVQIEDGPSLRVAFSTADHSAQHNSVTWLQEVSRTMDILEPMDRILAALKNLCGEEKRG
jgi:hypothetical protein